MVKVEIFNFVGMFRNIIPRLFLLFMVLLVAFFSCKRKPYPDYLIPVPAETTDFLSVYGGSGDEEVFAVIATSDSSYLMVGATTTLSNGDKDLYLAKTDLNGNLLWSKSIGGAAIDGGFDVVETTDNSYIATGFSKSYNFTNGYEIFAVKTDPSGNILWQKTFGDLNNDCAKSIVRDNGSGNFILAGGSNGVNTQLGSRVYVVQMSVNGDSLWTKQYDGSTIEIGQSVCIDSYNNIMVLSGCENSIAGSHLFLNYLNLSGDTIWSKTIDPGQNEKAGQIVSVPGNAFVSVNTLSTASGPLGDILLFKVSDTGNILWEKNIDSGFEERGNSILLSSDDNLLIAGGETNNQGLMKALLIKTDLSGNVLWKKTFGDSANFVVNKVIETPVSYLLTGTKLLLTGSKDAFLIKVKK